MAVETMKADETQVGARGSLVIDFAFACWPSATSFRWLSTT